MFIWYIHTTIRKILVYYGLPLMEKSQAAFEATDHSQPAYLAISQQIKAEISSGFWVEGGPIPTEPKLAEQFGVSIGTIRHAMRLLCNEGLLVKRQGLGTFVQPSNQKQAYLSPSLPFELTEDATTKGDIKSKVKHVEAGHACPSESKALGIEENSPIWRVAITHSFRERVVAYEIIAISQVSNPDLTESLLNSHADNLHRLANEVLKRRIQRICDKVQIHPLTPEITDVFSESDGSAPFLRVYRTTTSINDEPIEHREIWIDPSLAHYAGQPKVI